MAEPPSPDSPVQSAPDRSGPWADLPGATVDDVRALQETLGRLGFMEGEADGTYGAATAEAVRRFQATVGLPADGLAGEQTMERLAQVTQQAGEPAQTKMAQEPATQEPFSPQGPPPPSRPVQVVLLHSPEDAEIVDRLVQAISRAAADVPSRCAAVASLDDPAIADFDPAALVVPCLSRAFLSSVPATAVLERRGRGAAVMPLLLEPLDLASTPFADLPALDGGTALSEWPDLEAWLPVLGRQIATLGQLVSAGPRSFLPRFSTDGLEGRDLLERRDRVEFLASVLAAKELETPLAVGLFGDWGSGKSFFMRRLQERIVALTEASAQAAESGQPSLYCSRVRHVTFNAWLHAGTNIWPAFAAQVFRGVAGLETEAPQGAAQATALVEYQERVRGERAREERIRQLEGELTEKRKQLSAIQPQASGPAGKLAGTIGEIGTRLLGLREGWRDLRLGDLLPLALVGVAIAAFFFAEAWMGWVATGAAVVLAVVRYADERRKLRGDVRALESRLSAERAAQAAAPEGGQAELLLPEFARQEAAAWAERAEADAITQIRTKFERLSRLIGESVAARAAAEGEPDDTVPIERVIVYVDDLDRCQHDVVVSVLETLKLLVSLPHFVAVVGVDSRWLFRSLQLHFRDLLQGDDDAGDGAWAATPQNYLEKVFQYSIVLQPISEAGFANLIEDLLAPPPEVAPVPANADGQAQEAELPAADAAPPPTQEGSLAPAAPAAAPALDLNPGELVISREEVEFIKGLAPLFETPRAAKRLANVYRLMRVSVGTERLLDAESYEPALLLLALGIGFPGLAGETFARIARSPDATWPEFLGQLPADDEARAKLRDDLHRCSPHDIADRQLATFAPWIPVVAEFSFHPWQELLPATAQS